MEGALLLHLAPGSLAIHGEEKPDPDLIIPARSDDVAHEADV